MTALLEYLDLLRDAWEAKLLHAKGFLNLPYASYCPMRLSWKVHAPASPEPRLSEPLRTIARWLRGTIKCNFWIT